MGDPLPYSHLHAAGGDEDHSHHEESISPINGHGRGASTSDAAQRGRKDSPVDQAMPVTPWGDLERGAWDNK